MVGFDKSRGDDPSQPHPPSSGGQGWSAPPPGQPSQPDGQQAPQFDPAYGQQYGQQYGQSGMGAMNFGTDPRTGLPYSDKQKTTAGLLQLLLLFVGVPGVGRLYVGRNDIGLIQLIGGLVSLPLMCLLVGLFTYPVFLVWSIIDGIIMLTSDDQRDGQGRILRP